MKKIEKSNTDINNEKKWTNELEKALVSNDELQKQFAKDSKLTDKKELSYKLYLYKKNNLDLFYKILKQKYNELIKPDDIHTIKKIEVKPKSDKDRVMTELEEMGLMESFKVYDEYDTWNDIINDYYKIVKHDEMYIILDIVRGQIDSVYKDENECLYSFNKLTHDKNSIEDTQMNEQLKTLDLNGDNPKQLFPNSPNQKGNWNMLSSYPYERPEKKEYNRESIQKLIQHDTFLKFAFDTIKNKMEYEDALKKIYDVYIKDDKVLLNKLKIYESYTYMKLNEESNNNYELLLNAVLDDYGYVLTEEENMSTFIINEITNMIDINVDMLKTNIKTYTDNVKTELYDLMKMDIVEFVNKIEETNIQYEDILNVEPDDFGEVDDKLVDALGISTQTANALLLTASIIELNTLLYIDEEEVITAVYFACLYLILKNAL